MGHALSAADGTIRSGTPAWQFGKGLALTLGGFVASMLAGCTIERLARQVPFGWLLAGLAFKTLFAWRALDQAADAVRRDLAHGDLDAAKLGLRALVSRDPATFDAGLVAAAAIESLAENFGDSVAGPVLAFGVGGLGAAAGYRWLNTADAMIGYRGAYEWAGKAAAKLDDLANVVPARLAALLLLAAAPRQAKAGAAVARRDAWLAASPNAGWPMAAMAGLLGRRLEKPGHYCLNASASPPDAQDITRARDILRRAVMLMLVLECGMSLAGAVRRAVHRYR